MKNIGTKYMNQENNAIFLIRYIIINKHVNNNSSKFIIHGSLYNGGPNDHSGEAIRLHHCEGGRRPSAARRGQTTPLNSGIMSTYHSLA